MADTSKTAGAAKAAPAAGSDGAGTPPSPTSASEREPAGTSGNDPDTEGEANVPLWNEDGQKVMFTKPHAARILANPKNAGSWRTKE